MPPDGKHRRGVWRMPVTRDEEIEVLDPVHGAGGWTVGRKGIYFRTSPDKEGRSEIAAGVVIKVLPAEPSGRLGLLAD